MPRTIRGAHTVRRWPWANAALLSLAAAPWVVSAAAQQGLGKPVLPRVPFPYADAEIAYPRYVWDPDLPGTVKLSDNTPADNPVTDSGATLGRVLFYDRRLSRNFTVSCGTCHRQSHGFSDPARFSTGLYGDPTVRHAMGIADSRYYVDGKFFWDEHAPTLEQQVLMPIQSPTEMDMSLPEAVARIQATPFYAPLFSAAFGSPDVTADRVSKSLAQFVRAAVSFRTKYDSAFDANGAAHFEQVLTPQEFLGLRLFSAVPGYTNISVGCDRCHTTFGQIANRARNNGLDLVTLGGGRFKSPSLRNIGARAPYMHDGRFATLRDVVEFYDHGVQDNPDLDPILRDPITGQVKRLNLTNEQKDALVAFMQTLTDVPLLTEARFSDPFVRPRLLPHRP